MNDETRLSDVVALTDGIPERGLVRGQAGTVVELLESDVFEVEFCDDNGRTYVVLALRADQFMVLHYQPRQIA